MLFAHDAAHAKEVGSGLLTVVPNPPPGLRGITDLRVQRLSETSETVHVVLTSRPKLLLS